MKLLFVNPIVRFDFFNGGLKINLGLLYLASISMKMGHNVFVKNISKFEYPYFIRKIKPDIVLISCVTTQQMSAIKMAEQTRRYNPNIIVIMGGYFPTFNYKILLKQYSNLIDFIVVGEGEKTLELLLKCLEEKKKKYNKIKGLAFVKDNKIVFTGKRPLIKNLDKLPFPARFLMNRKVNDIIFSRGCSMNCKFCSIKKFYGDKIRFRSLKNFVEEINMMCENGHQRVNISDDNFLVNLKQLNQFRSLLKRKNIKVKFSVMLRIDSIDDKKIRILNSLNFVKIYFGVQSIDNNILKFFDTGFDYERLKVFFGYLKKVKDLDMKINLFYIINSGLPKEDGKMIIKNMNKFLLILKENKIRNVKITPYILIPNIGSDIYSFFKKKGYFKNQRINALDNWPKYEYNGLNEKKLMEYYYKFVKKLSKEKMLSKDTGFPNITTINSIKYLALSSLSFKVKFRITLDIIFSMLMMKSPKNIKKKIKDKYF